MLRQVLTMASSKPWPHQCQDWCHPPQSLFLARSLGYLKKGWSMCPLHRVVTWNLVSSRVIWFQQKATQQIRPQHPPELSRAFSKVRRAQISVLLNEIFKDSKKPGRNGDETPNKSSYDSLNVIVENFQLAASTYSVRHGFSHSVRVDRMYIYSQRWGAISCPHSLPPWCSSQSFVGKAFKSQVSAIGPIGPFSSTSAMIHPNHETSPVFSRCFRCLQWNNCNNPLKGFHQFQPFSSERHSQGDTILLAGLWKIV